MNQYEIVGTRKETTLGNTQTAKHWTTCYRAELAMKIAEDWKNNKLCDKVTITITTKPEK